MENGSISVFKTMLTNINIFFLIPVFHFLIFVSEQEIGLDVGAWIKSDSMIFFFLFVSLFYLFAFQVHKDVAASLIQLL